MTRSYLVARCLIPLIASTHLKRRLARGKEHPTRWTEKLGRASAARPEGRLIWMHAVGLGEVLALRGLIDAIARRDPTLNFLITSSSRTSGQVIADNLPVRTQHQFLPLDAPGYVTRFLDHWRPDLSVWAEQEVWPGMIVQTHARGVPIALVNGRITAQSFARKQRAKGLFRDILTRMSLITAQDPDTAKRLTQLGARAAKVSGSLKPAAPALAVDAARLAQMQRLIGSRRVWVAASSHAGDEAEAIAAQASLTDWLLILVPRDVARAAEVAAKLAQAGLRYAQQSTGGMPSADDQVYLADSYGELGLWYHLAQVAFVGGGFDNIGGHNPWEPAILGAAVLHGPDVHNFAADYTLLHGTAAAIRVDAGQLATTIATLDAAALTTQATRLVAEAHLSLDGLAADLLALIGVPT